MYEFLLTAEKYTTISKVLPLSKQLIKIYSKEDVDFSEVIMDFRADLLTKLKTKFGKYEELEVYADSTLLDPRYKNVFENTQNFNMACERIKAEALTLFREENPMTPSNETYTPPNKKVKL